MSRVNRPVSTRVGRKRNAIEVSGANSTSAPQAQQLFSKQKQITQRDKLRSEYIKELESLEQQYVQYRATQISTLQAKLKIYSERLSQIKDIAELQQAIALKAQSDDIKKQVVALEEGYDLQLIAQLKTLIEASGIKKEVKKEEMGLGGPSQSGNGPSPSTPYLQAFLDKFHKAPVHLFVEDYASEVTQGEDTEFCPDHKTRLVMTVEDGSMSCTECGYHTACVDTSVDTTSNEEVNTARDALMDKVLKLFEQPDHEMTEEEWTKSGGSKELVSLERGIEFCQEQREKKRLRGLNYDNLFVSDVDAMLKASKNKELSVRFGQCHLFIASSLNNQDIPRFTSAELQMIKRLRLLVREALQMLQPTGTMFNAVFAFIRFCQILTVKFHKDYQRFIPWVPKLTHKGRLQKQEQFWFSVTIYCGLPQIFGQDVLSIDTVKLLRHRFNVTTAQDDL